MEQKTYLTVDFWMAILSTILMVLIALGVIGEGVGQDVEALAAPLIAAVLPIVVFILNRFRIRAAAVRNGLVATDKPQWLQSEFWMTIVSTLAVVLIAVGAIDQGTGDNLIALAAPFVAAVLPVLAYLLGYGHEQVARLGGVQ